ncbi:TPA: hypothetical protein ACTY5A_001072 [Klebsiella aerogenes]
MTKSTITRERLEKIKSWRETYGAENNVMLPAEEAEELARMALAAMDSEPVKRVNADQMHRVCLEANRHLDKYVAMAKEVNKLLGRTPAQPAPVAQPVMFIDGDISSEDADKLAKVIREFNEEDERPLAKMARIIRENPHPTNECDMPKAQPAPVVLEDVSGPLAHAYKELTPTFMRNHIAVFERYGIAPSDSATVIQALRIALDGIERRAAMLQAEPVTTANKLGNSPVIPDGYVMVPKEPTDEMQSAGASAIRIETTALNKLWTGNAVFRAMLAAAPQEVK